MTDVNPFDSGGKCPECGASLNADGSCFVCGINSVAAGVPVAAVVQAPPEPPREWPAGATAERPPAEQEAKPQPPPERRSTWRFVDLTEAVKGDQTGPTPTLLVRDDGHGLFYPGKVHTVSGESESLKTWLALVAARQEIKQRHHVLWFDFEDDENSVAGRLLALGCPPDDILTYFHYVSPEEAPDAWFTTVDLPALLNPMPTLAVFDGVTEAMTLLGYDPDRGNADVARFIKRVPRPVADAGPAVDLIDHVSKSKETRGRYALGGVHKLNVVNGAAYTVELKQDFGHGRTGRARITIAKDRPGRVREHCPGKVAGDLVLKSWPDGSVTAELYPPEGAERPRDEPPPTFRPTILMERISQYAIKNPALSGRSLLAAVKGNTDHKKLALELLVAEGYIEVQRRQGRGGGFEHHSKTPFLAVNDQCGDDDDE